MCGPRDNWDHLDYQTTCVVKEKDLTVVEHDKVIYKPFRKAFYHAPPRVTEITGDEGILAIMSGGDAIGMAKTDSGKTIAFLLPLFRRIKNQLPLETMEGLMAIIITLTRELAVQIHRGCKPFLKAVCTYGGSPIKDEIALIKKGCEIIVCTPSSTIDLLTTNSGHVTNLCRVTYLVLDKTDRVFKIGFEPQVMTIVDTIRPDGRTVQLSATFPKQMDSLSRKLRKPLQTTTCEDSDARTLSFVDSQEAVDNLLHESMRKGYMCMSLHGRKDQMDRDATIADLKAGLVPNVIAPSVAARVLDVKQLNSVINYDALDHMEDYAHCAGRMGRAGNRGTCVTFIPPKQERYSVDIFRALEANKASILSDLEQLGKGFLDKVKIDKAQSYVGAGLGGRGLDKFDQSRDVKDMLFPQIIP
ncbi:pre-mRNA processing RNA-helicase [Ceratobasidium sp. 423]|nr:pre-mRNA processing RNA-helicase [Ceratobasidium sp. 423]